MSCGPLNGLLTSSADLDTFGPVLQGFFPQSTNPKFQQVPLECNLEIVFLEGLLTSSLELSNFVLPYGTDKTNLAYSYNLVGELSSSMPFEACLLPT